MKVNELLSSVRNTLQDSDKNYWDDSELLSYYNECKRSMAAERLERKTTATLILDPLKNEYDTSGILRYISAKDDNDTNRKLYPNDTSGDDDSEGIVILDYNRVYVNNPELGTSILLQIVAMPEEDNLGGLVRIGDENAMKYYILSKAYEKDTDMGNFQKSVHFYSKYSDAFKLLKDANSSNYQAGVTRASKSYYY